MPKKYFLGILGSLLHLIGIIFLCSSLYLNFTIQWNMVIPIIGIFFYSIDWWIIWNESKIYSHFRNSLFRLLVIDVIVFSLIFIIWFIEPWTIETESHSLWNYIKTVVIFLFIIFLFVSLIYRTILGYYLYNYSYEKISFRFHLWKVLSQLIFLVLLLASFNLVLVKWDFTIDLTPGFYSFSKKARDIIQNIHDQNIKIFIFLPDQQLVKTKKDTTVPDLYRFSEELRIMFQSISKINPSIQVEFYNADLLENHNQSFGNVNNGTIILRNYKENLENIPYTERRVYVYTIFDFKKLEQNFIRALLQIASEPIKIYFSRGYGERYQSSQKKPYDIDFFIQVLRVYNFEIHDWNEKNGFPVKIPEDANIVLFAGPAYPFTQETKKAIIHFIEKRKGKIMILIDPNGKEHFNWLLKTFSPDYSFQRAVLMQIQKKPFFIYTDQTGTHTVMENINQIPGKRFLLIGKGYFKQNQKKRKAKIKGYQTSPILFTTFTTWEEKNQNYKKDKDEKNQRYILGLAIEKGNSKILIFSDVEWITNRILIQNLYNLNLQLATNSLFYLANKMEIPGILEKKKEDRNIIIEENTKTKLLIIGIIGIPLCMVLGIGSLIYFYHQRHKRQI